MSPRNPSVPLYRSSLFAAVFAFATAGLFGQATLVKDINPGTAAGIQQSASFIVFNGYTYFRATDGVNGVELWRTDGTLGNTTMVMDINPGAAGSLPANFVVMGSDLFFTATTALAGTELWKTDGTTTQLVADINAGAASSTPTELVEMNGALYFAANDGLNGVELWTSDGTGVGTTLLKDIAPGQIIFFPPFDSNPRWLTRVGNEILFSADDHVNGVELWKTDGTTFGTVLVKDIFPGSTFGPNSANPELLTNVGGTLLFRATDGVSNVELWRSDGTPGGTVLVQDINPGVATSLPQSFKVVGTTLFFQATDATNGAELWKCVSPYTSAALVKDIYPGITSSSPTELANVNGVLYFQADNGTNGIELWKSDGTTGGTVLVKDINPGAGSSSPRGIVGLPGSCGAVFAATNGTNGFEPWRTDGSAGGTALVQDIRTGSASSVANVAPEFTIYNSIVLFAATNGTSSGQSGVEVWSIPTGALAGAGPSISVPPMGVTVCPGGTISLSVTASGGGLTYQWRKNTVPLLGQVNPTLVINNAQPTDSGSYDVVVTNGCGSITSTAAAVVVTDTQAPSASAGSIAACYPSQAAAEAAAVAATTATDNCASPGQLSFSASTVGDCAATITVTVTDPSNNSTQVTYNTRIDGTAPVANSSGPIALCSLTQAAAEAAALTNSSATDNCSGPLTPHVSTVLNGCVATISVTFTDGCNNVSNALTYMSRIDTVAPMGTAGSIGTCYQTTAAAEAAAIAATTVSDNCSAPAQITKTASTVGTCSAVVTVTVTDECLNSTSVTYNTRIDATVPTVLPGSIAVCYPTQAAAEAAAILATGAADNCPGGLSKSAVTTGTCAATIVVTVADGCNNQATATYHTRIDGTAPLVTAGSIAGCYATVGAAEAAALAATSASDDCTAPGQLLKTAATVGTCSAVVTVTVRDECNNAATTTYNTRIDNTPPTASTTGTIGTCYASQALAEAAALAISSGSDDCPGTLTPVVTTAGTCSAVILVKYLDGCGNESNVLTYNTRIDNTPPTASTTGTIGTCYASQALAEAAALAISSGSDDCPGTLTPVVTTAGTCSAVITVKYVDGCGNESNVLTYNTRIDNTPPTASSTGTIGTCYATQALAEAAALAISSGSDDCPGTLTPVVTTAGTCSALIQVKYVDGCGNESNVLTYNTRIDNTPPTFTGCPGNITVPASIDPCSAMVSWAAPVASDNCGMPAVVPSHNPGAIFPEGSTTVTYTATDGCGLTATCSFTVIVTAVAPQISIQPQTQTVNCFNGSATFSVTAGPAAPPLSYQWRHNFVPIMGATNPTLVINPALPADAGTYDVIVSNSCGSTSSNPAVLTVSGGPTIWTQPQAIAVCEGAPGIVSVSATGCPPLTYQWYKDNVLIPGAIGSSYTIPSFTANDRAVYTVVVTDCCGSVTSDGAFLHYISPPQIAIHPASRSAYTGAATNFFVLVSSSAPETYQWRHNTVPIPGANGNGYSIPRLHLADAGQYDVVVTNQCGSVTSNPATLNVLPFILVFDQPFGSLSVRVQNIGGVAAATYFSSFSLDPLNGTNPDQGPWFGQFIALPDLIQQFLFGFPPFVGTLDGAGGSLFALPSNGLDPSLIGLTFYGMTMMADLSGPTVLGATNIPALTVN